MTTSLSGVHYKGFTIQNLLVYVNERFGAETAQAAIQSLPAELRVHTDPRTALAIGWVPVEVYFGIVEHTVARQFGGNPEGAQTIGYEATLRDIHSIFKMVLRFTSPGMVLGMARRMWRSYCDQGELLHKVENGMDILSLRDFSYQTPISLNELAGGFKAYLECSNAKNPRLERLPPAPDGTLRWRIHVG